MLLVDKLYNCKEKEKGKEYTKGQIKEIQDTYKQDNLELKKPIVNNKKQVQEEEIFLYKLYNAILFKYKTLEPMFIQDKIDNLEKYMKYMQLLVKMIPFYPSPHYKSL